MLFQIEIDVYRKSRIFFFNLASNHFKCKLSFFFNHKNCTANSVNQTENGNKEYDK